MGSISNYFGDGALGVGSYGCIAPKDRARERRSQMNIIDMSMEPTVLGGRRMRMNLIEFILVLEVLLAFILLAVMAARAFGTPKVKDALSRFAAALLHPHFH